MTPILKGTAARLGLRKPTGVYRYKDGTIVWWDEAVRWAEEVLGVKAEPFRREYLNTAGQQGAEVIANSDGLSSEVLCRLSTSARYHQVRLRVTPELYDAMLRFKPEEPPFGRPPIVVPPIPLGAEVEVVTDGSENVRRVGESWVFIAP